MSYTTDERGILNNYATEANVYLAEYPTPEEQNRYKLQGAVAVLFISLLLLTAFGVS